jgi:hypothetical protein
MSTFWEVHEERAKNAELSWYTQAMISTNMIARASHKIRGITMEYLLKDEKKQLNIYFYCESELNEYEQEALEEAKTYIFTDLSQSFYWFDFFVEVIPLSESLTPKAKNWGWVFKRLEAI